MLHRPLSGILVTGSNGQVGGELLRTLAPLGPIHAPSRADLDLSHPESIRAAVRTLRPRWIVNAAAYTAVDRAETESAEAFNLNAEAPRILGEEAREIGAVVLHFSTDYVFPGTASEPRKETDTTGPLNVYGSSKLAGEQALRATGATHLIFRTSWVFSAAGQNFLLTILRLARERRQVRVVNDQCGAPTSARDLARLTADVIEQCEARACTSPHALAQDIQTIQGIYHACSAGETSWFGFAQEALRLRALVEPATHFAELIPIPTCDYPTPAARPGNSRLDCNKLDLVFHHRLPPWQQAIAEVLSELPLPDPVISPPIPSS